MLQSCSTWFKWKLNKHVQHQNPLRNLVIWQILPKNLIITCHTQYVQSDLKTFMMENCKDFVECCICGGRLLSVFHNELVITQTCTVQFSLNFTHLIRYRVNTHCTTGTNNSHLMFIQLTYYVVVTDYNPSSKRRLVYWKMYTKTECSD